MFLLGLLVGAVLSGVVSYRVGYIRGEEEGYEVGSMMGTLAMSRVEWQPIETAPKDGRTIILAHETSFLGYWDASQSAWCDNRQFYRDPSLWMPLPPVRPPELQGNKQHRASLETPKGANKVDG